MKRWIKYLGYVGGAAILTLSLMGAILYSSAGQRMVRSFVLSVLHKEGLHAKVESFEGFLIPNRLTLKHLSMDHPEMGKLSVKTVQVRLSLLYLLKREIRFTEVKAWDASYTSPSPSERPRSEGSPPFQFVRSISIQSFQAFSVTIDGLGPLYVEGQMEAKSRGRGFALDIRAQKDQDLLLLQAKGKQRGLTNWNLRLHVANSQWLQKSLPVSVHGALELEAKGTHTPKKGVQGKFQGNALLQEVPYALQGPWGFKGRIEQSPANGRWSFSHLDLQNGLLEAKASGSFDARGTFLEASGQLHVAEALFAPAEGELYARWMLRKDDETLVGKTVAHIPHLRYKTIDLDPIELLIDSTDIQGSLSAKGADWQIAGQFAWQDALQLTELSLTAPHMQGQGQWEFASNGEMKGAIEMQIDNLHLLQPLFPEWDPYGRLIAKVTSDGPKATVDIIAKQLYLKSVYFEQAAFYSDLQDPFTQAQGVISIDMEKGKFRDLVIDSALLETKSDGDHWLFNLFAEGVWNRDFESRCSGVWQMTGEEFTAEISDFHGLFYSHPFSLQEQVTISYLPEKTEVSPAQILFPEGASIFGQWIEEPSQSSLTFTLAQFPLDFLSINPLEVAVTGQLDLDLQMTRANAEWQGELEASIQQVEMIRLGETEPITAHGSLNAKLKSERLSMEGSLSTRGLPLTSFALEAPVHIEKQPWQARLLYEKPTKGTWHFDGRIEDCLDFFNLRSHWLEGQCLADISWSHTLKRPIVKGSLQLLDGYYENYQTGTQLTDLQIQLLAERSKLRLVSLQATDRDGTGRLVANGVLDLRIDQKLPFQARLRSENLQFMQLGFLTTKANSALQIKGNLEKMLVQGEVHLIDSAITIPDSITKSPPELQVVYLNAQKPTPLSFAPSSKPYPIHFFLSIDTIQDVSIAGRGLQSEWEGKFILKGTQIAPKPTGQLNLVKGEFAFAGRLFKLTTGSIAFTALDPHVPQIKLSGAMQQQGISIIANLHGPLNRPQITFQSIPALPLSAIISYLLFGQDISEINGLQALQLAATIANIAGESPDVLESTRRSLGIDRLRIVSSDDGEESLSIQVGKYVAPGVLVSISQNAEESAPNVIIEVDIGKGFFFQAETDQVHEQGKFGVKWNRNY